MFNPRTTALEKVFAIIVLATMLGGLFYLTKH